MENQLQYHASARDPIGHLHTSRAMRSIDGDDDLQKEEIWEWVKRSCGLKPAAIAPFRGRIAGILRFYLFGSGIGDLPDALGVDLGAFSEVPDRAGSRG